MILSEELLQLASVNGGESNGCDPGICGVGCLVCLAPGSSKLLEASESLFTKPDLCLGANDFKSLILVRGDIQ